MKTDNELIADFLGLGWHDNGTVSHFPSVLKMRMGVDTKADLKFDTSWDWLMPVVEKIESLKIKVYQDAEVKNGTLADVQFKRGRNNSYLCQITYFEHDGGAHKHSRAYTGIILTEDGVRLNSVYKTVVEFIKWYNSQAK